jgi:hypothetical protein
MNVTEKSGSVRLSVLGMLLAATMVVVACGGDDDDDGSKGTGGASATGGSTGTGGTTTGTGGSSTVTGEEVKAACIELCAKQETGACKDEELCPQCDFLPLAPNDCKAAMKAAMDCELALADVCENLDCLDEWMAAGSICPSQ